MAGTMGWKDILRPIRDGYRHLFPVPDTGPTPEERRRRREQDRLKGFTYFDTFEQLELWDVTQSDPLQRANTPLLPRCTITEVEKKPKANVLLCHDYAGNYHDYESVQGAPLDDEMYACEYLQHVEAFVYFSHKLVCVPPPTWTNTLHRNGVKVLGTILLEPQTKETERLLRLTGTGDDMTFCLASKLAAISKHYGFDGFLVNIEKPFPNEIWSPELLCAFLAQLKTDLGDDMELIWYDALTLSNETSYQNSLSAANVSFAKACGKILTNYCWTEPQARDSKRLAVDSGFAPSDIFFGIDVWAQSNTSITHPRSTYPRRGGGGTNTGIAVTKLAEEALSAGIFAPAWSFEHFTGHGRDIERTMWEGRALPSDLDCSCGNAAYRHLQTGSSITQDARSFPAGSANFFYTDFARAFTARGEDEQDNAASAHTLRAQLGSQAVLPLPSRSADQIERNHVAQKLEEDDRGRSRLAIGSHTLSTAPGWNIDDEDRWVPLYKVNMPADGSLKLSVTYRNLVKATMGTIPSLYVRFTHSNQPHLISVAEGEGVRTIDTRLGTPSDASDIIRVEELGFHVGGPVEEGTIPLLELYSILVMRAELLNASQEHNVHNIRMEHRGEGENRHARLCWDYTEGPGAGIHGMPYSDITGACSHFVVNVNGARAGSVYALEFIVAKSLAEAVADQEVAVEIIGVGFDGRNVACQSTTLRISTE